MNRRRIIVRAIVVVVVLGLVAVVISMCASMTIGSLRAVPKLQGIVGEYGTVSAVTREAQINVTPRCELTVRFTATASRADVASVLSRIAPMDAYQPCEVTGVEMPSRASLSVAPDAWERQDAAAWEVIADKLMLPDPMRISVMADQPSMVTSFRTPNRYIAYISMLRGLIVGAPLEDVIGPVDWKLDWQAKSGSHTSVTLDILATPPVELPDFLEAVTPYLDGRTTSVEGVTFSDRGDEAVTQVDFRDNDPAATQAIREAFEESGLAGDLVLEIPDGTLNP